jgi:spermidine synthase
LASPLSHLVIDDGRRYLERSPQKYDAIIIDPFPPVQVAGSGLLYSEEFDAANQRVQPGGILQQCSRAGGMQYKCRFRALKNSFPVCEFTDRSKAGVGTSWHACVRFLLAMPRTW